MTEDEFIDHFIEQIKPTLKESLRPYVRNMSKLLGGVDGMTEWMFKHPEQAQEIARKELKL